MKLLTGCLVLVVLATATGADAWPWSRRVKRLPQPIDSPIVRPKNKTADHRVTRMHHPSVHNRHAWGVEWDKTLKVTQSREGNHSIFRD